MNEKLPNIVVFISDQHHPEMMSCAKDPYVQTPNLDRLATEGVRFDNCYCGFPLCVPSRMNFVTGQACHKLKIWGNDDCLDSNVPTFAHGLSMAGYRTVLVGRMHFVGNDQLHGFHERRLGDVCGGFPFTNRAEDRFGGYYGNIDSIYNAGPGRSVDQEFDTAVAMEACRVIRDHEVSKDTRPLCLVVGFYSPHDAYRVYDKYYQQYADIDEVPIDTQGEHLHPFYQNSRKSVVDRGIDETHTRRARAAYRGKTTLLDELIGRIMERVADSSLAENCMQIYTSDHGDMAGEHGLWAKGNFYDSSARVPLIVSWPGHIEQGVLRHELVGLDYVGPTLIDIAGAEMLPETEGKSFKRLLMQKDPGWNPVIYSELNNPLGLARMVRRGSWKLNVYPGFENELFNLDTDPEECHNLVKDPAHSDLVNELGKLAYEDGWSPEDIQAIQNERKANYSYIRKWALKLEPHHSIQWGLPAEL